MELMNDLHNTYMKKGLNELVDCKMNYRRPLTPTGEHIGIFRTPTLSHDDQGNLAGNTTFVNRRLQFDLQAKEDLQPQLQAKETPS